MKKAELVRRKRLADGMTPAQQRRAVLIAEDVLKWLRTKRLEVETGAYFIFDAVPESLWGQQLRDHLRELVKPTAPCAVCALGACFIASVDRFNEVKINGVFGGFSQSSKQKVVSSHLLDTFSLTQMDLIEAAFERSSVQGFWGVRSGTKDEPSAIALGRKYNNARTRLRAIMRNIIANRGVFVPPAIPAISEAA